MTNKKIKVVLLEPNEFARVAEIDASLEGMQKIVGGLIECGYYFQEEVCCVVNEEGKIMGLDLNRGVYDEKGRLIDIIAGTAFICDGSGEDFDSLSDEQLEKYLKQFRLPEKFFKINGQIKGIPFNPDLSLNSKIRDWYVKAYPSDDLGEDIDKRCTFDNIFDALDNYQNIYEVLGVSDSVIRERVFNQLAIIIGVDYDYIYKQWLRGV